MNQRTEREMRDLSDRMMRMRALAQQANEARAAEHEAIRRRNEADKKFAAEWAETVRQYGEQNAPTWYSSLRGPKPTIEVKL